MITSADNDKLKTIRKLQAKRWRERLDLFAVEGEDLVAAATWEPEFLLVAGEDVEPELLDAVSSLGSGTRVIGVFPRRWSEPGGNLSVYLHGVADPGNVGSILRSAHALCQGPVVLGPGCADPFSPKAIEPEPPIVLCVGAEREGLPAELLGSAEASARIPLRPDGPESLNAAMATTVALYEVANRMAGHG
jgi:TrmH family RNA methyltransferase